MQKFLGTLLMVWIALSVLGFVFKGVIWLSFIGIVLFLVTALIGVMVGGKQRKQ